MAFFKKKPHIREYVDFCVRICLECFEASYLNVTFPRFLKFRNNLFCDTNKIVKWWLQMADI